VTCAPLQADRVKGFVIIQSCARRSQGFAQSCAAPKEFCVPTYEYKCTECDHQFDIWQEVGTEPPACPECGSQVKKIFHPVSVHYKGSGFYVTDSRSKSEKKSETKIETKSDDKSSETKPAASEITKTETTATSSSSSTSDGGDKAIK